jgi:transcription elongation factor Elf1
MMEVINMLESTNLDYQQVLDNTDSYSKWFDNADVSEYEQAFKDANK